ncbi:MAG TPA: cysteine ABC transporter substrate-binding protein [Candidatus Merdenecus merdavium]|nr:cysteine ABC transporter substrate-binding protein [Candidatus Merdenecus merdavium]
MKKFKKVIGMVLALSMVVVGLGACSGKNNDEAKGSLEQIKENDKIRIGVFGDKPPFGYVDSNGDNQGYDVYFAKRIAKDLLGDESKVEFVLVEAASRVEYLESNKVDIILANFTVTDERKEVVDFADPYMKVSLGVVSPEGAEITDVSQFEGKKLIVNKGTTAEVYFKNNYPDIELVSFEQNTEAFNALKDGRGDALAHDNTLVFAWAIENPGFVTGIRSLGDVDIIAPAVKKGDDELKDWINEEIKSLADENFFHEDFKETLLPVYGDQVDPEDVVVEGGQL